MNTSSIFDLLNSLMNTHQESIDEDFLILNDQHNGLIEDYSIRKIEALYNFYFKQFTKQPCHTNFYFYNELTLPNSFESLKFSKKGILTLKLSARDIYLQYKKFVFTFKIKVDRLPNKPFEFKNKEILYFLFDDKNFCLVYFHKGTTLNIKNFAISDIIVTHTVSDITKFCKFSKTKNLLLKKLQSFVFERNKKRKPYNYKPFKKRKCKK